MLLLEPAWIITKYFVLLPLGFGLGALLLGYIFTTPGRPWWDERIVWRNDVRIEPASVWIWAGLLAWVFYLWLNQ